MHFFCRWMTLRCSRVFLFIGGAALLTACGESPSLQPEADRQAISHPSESDTRLVLLGTGTPIPETASQGPASAIVAGDRAYLVDAGTGVVRQAQAAYEDGITALKPDQLNIVFITHLHSDHTLGLPDLLFTPWIIGADDGLSVYGPPGIKEMITHILAAWNKDLSVREKGKSPTESLLGKIDIHEISAGRVYKDENVSVTAVPVTHGDWSDAFGFKFTTATRTIVISGDTTPCEAIVKACHGCDVLLHEVYSHAGFIKGPPEWRRYHATYHTSTLELAQLARKARPKQLVLYHNLFFGQSESGMVKEITDRYPGTVTLGTDGSVF